MPSKSSPKQRRRPLSKRTPTTTRATTKAARKTSRAASPTPPTDGPSPLDLTREVLDVSVTERGQFRKCRRQWHLETIENLAPKRPTIELDFGTGLHSALEAYYLGAGEGAHDLDAAHNALDEWLAEAVHKADDLEQPPEVHEELIEHTALGHTMLDNYVRFDQASRVPLGDTIAVEGQPVGDPTDWHVPKGYPPLARVTLHESGRLLVPIVDPETKQVLEPRSLRDPGRKLAPTSDMMHVPMLSARIDLLTLRKTPKKGLWVVDHKSAGSQPSDRGWDFDDQATGYCYVVWRWTGKIPRGVVPNYLIKQAPKPPRIVGKHKDKLSTAKDQLTTPDMYREALKEHGLIMPGSGRIASDDHAACMAALLERGWDPFFRRFEVTRNAHELESFERRLYAEYHDMREATYNEMQRYPNPSTYWCPGCRVNSICHAMEDGSDYEDVIEHNFVQAEDRKAA
jgi:hypothetical protein